MALVSLGLGFFISTAGPMVALTVLGCDNDVTGLPTQCALEQCLVHWEHTINAFSIPPPVINIIVNKDSSLHSDVSDRIGEKILSGTSSLLTDTLALVKPLSRVRTLLQAVGSGAIWEVGG